MELKHYQSETLSTLRRFLEEARVAGPRNAYETITQEPEQAERLGRYASSYKPLDTLPDVPYVCLRLPTGGGKNDPGCLLRRHCPRCLDREGLPISPLAGAIEHHPRANRRGVE